MHAHTYARRATRKSHNITLHDVHISVHDEASIHPILYSQAKSRKSDKGYQKP
jgi:hypothetical protein